MPLPDAVSMRTRQPDRQGVGEIPLRRLGSEALRMQLSRIVGGEVRQEGCLDLLRFALLPEFVDANTSTGQFVVERDRDVDG